MRSMGSLDPDLANVIAHLDDGLRALYGERYRGLVLYGSHARGEAEEGSDVDLLLLLDGEVDQSREILRSEAVVWPLALENDLVLSVIPISVETWNSSREPFISNARREGVIAA